MARVMVTRELPFPALDRLKAAHDVEVWPEPSAPPPEVLRERAAHADALLTMLTDRVDAELLDAAPGVRAVSNFAVGTDNIDLQAAAERGVAVGSTPGVVTDATADLAIALMLALARRLPEGAARVREGNWGTWQPAEDLGLDLGGATFGVVGYGRIGQAAARRAEAFGMRVVHTSRSERSGERSGEQSGERSGERSGGERAARDRKRAARDRKRAARDRGLSLDELLSEADVVSLHVPLTPATRHLIDETALSAMKPTAILINTARGGVVDQAALRDALHARAIAGAALDVTDPEPLPPDDPLLDAPNLLVLPHIGTATTGTRARMADMAVDNLLAALDGRPMPHPAA